MKILAFSDSHGRTERILTALKQHSDTDYVLHIGDYGTDIKAVEEYNPTLPTDAVQGNADRIRAYPWEKLLTLAGKRFFITHGHNYDVGHSLTPIIARGLELKADVILFGHTHMPGIEKQDGILLVNPGSTYRQRSLSGYTYAEFTVTTGEIKVQICKL